ncbi:MAG: precorrin-6A reductase [Pseudomonadota bacterium]
MILLLGGTTEATSIARALAEEGFAVLLSTLTTISPRGELPAGIRRRNGKLEAPELIELIRTQRISSVVDATHPYATQISANAWVACRQSGIPYMAYERPSTVMDAPGIHRVSGHDPAAALICSLGRRVLLTIGVRNLSPYVVAARYYGVSLLARVLEQPSSIDACRRVGLNDEEILCANGPFSVEENTALITRHGIDVLVTKDSGEAGGVGTKITAALNCGCRVVIVDRPSRPRVGYVSIAALMEAVRTCHDPE